MYDLLQKKRKMLAAVGLLSMTATAVREITSSLRKRLKITSASSDADTAASQTQIQEGTKTSTFGE